MQTCRRRSRTIVPVPGIRNLPTTTESAIFRPGFFVLASPYSCLVRDYENEVFMEGEEAVTFFPVFQKET